MFFGQEIKLILDRKISIDDSMAGGGVRSGDKLRQAMIGLRADNNIHPRRTAADFLTFGLSNTSGHGDGHIAAGRASRSFQSRNRPNGKHLLGSFFTNMTGIDNHHICVSALVDGA